MILIPAPPPRTIEFLCPACQAKIRVHGAAIGSQGNCPACGTPVVVPDPGKQPGGPGNPVVEPAMNVAHEPSPAVQRRNRNRRNRAAYLIPLLLALLLGIPGLIYWLRPAPPLTGTIEGQVLPEVELGPFVIDRTYSTLPEGRYSQVVESLRTHPLRARTQIVRVEFEGTAKGITVSMHTGDDTVFVRVDPTNLVHLRDYIARHADEFEELRHATLQQAVPEFLQAVEQREQNAGAVEGLLEFRNRVGLASCVRGFGHVVVAKAQGTTYPCIHEDREGRLYFALPRGAPKFDLVGQPAASTRGSPLFPGTIHIRIGKAAPPARASSPERQPSPPSAESEEDEAATPTDAP
jgi:hypothetical protein